MKTNEELNTLKEEIETVDNKLHELSEEELSQVTGGLIGEDAATAFGKAWAVYVKGLITGEQFKEILCMMTLLGKEDYNRWAKDYERRNKLNLGSLQI